MDIEFLGESKQDWFAKLLDLSNGISSHHTFGRVFAALDAEQLQSCFAKWVESICEVLGNQVVAIVGKTLRRSHNQAQGKDAIQMVSAWAMESQLVLGQAKVNDKSNETKAIPVLLDLLDLSGCTVTINAIGTRTAIAKQIVVQGADYVPPVEGNRRTFKADTLTLFEDAQAIDCADCSDARTTEKDHGRIEIRECWATNHPDYLDALYKAEQWEGLQSARRCRATHSGCASSLADREPAPLGTRRDLFRR